MTTATASYPSGGKATPGQSKRLFTVVRYFLLSVLGLIFLFPIVYMLMSSLKPTAQMLTDSA